MELGRNETELALRMVVALERQADANEALIALANEEREGAPSGPPMCPHCDRMNPSITTTVDGSGPLGDFVLTVHCDHCESRFFAAPTGWFITENKADFERAE